jgi:AraC-like DNA-binding protein
VPENPSETPEIAVWHSPVFRPVELHHGFASRHPYPRHWHEELLVCAVTGGGGYLECRGEAHATPQGTLFLVEPGEVHANRPFAEGCSFRSIYVPAALLGDCAAQIASSPSFLPGVTRLVLEDSDIIARFLRLHQALEHPHPQLLRESLLLEFFARLLAAGVLTGSPTGATRRHPATARLVCEFLTENHAQAVSLADLAELTGLSPYGVHRAFARELGIPPHAYQTQVRITRAKALLREQFDIAEVAALTGFTDQSHLHRHFKRLVGVTPARFRASASRAA